jgi:hypothetical protein
MTRVVLAAVLAAVAFAAPANAAPIPIRHDRDATAIALAGPDVLVMSERARGGLRLVAVPRTGGRARTVLTVPGAGLSFDAGNLAASAQRLAVIVDVDGTRSRPDEHRVYSGPPSGPIRIVRRTRDPDGDAWTPFFVSVDGDRLLLVEGIPQYTTDDPDEDDDAGQVRVQILDGSGWTPVPWATGARVPVAIAGPYAAVVASAPRRIELADLATGTALATLTGEQAEGFSVDLAADGRIAVGMQSGIELATPGRPQLNVPNSGRLTTPRLAADRSIATFDDARNTLTLVNADASHSPLGPPSLIRTDVEADERGVAWLFNGCLRYEPLDAPAPATGKDPCPTSEVALYGIGPVTKLRGNTARVAVRCVTSATGRCRGRLVARLDYGTPIVARGRFNIPANDRWIFVPVRFDRRTVAKFHREDGGSALVNAIMRDGSVGSGADYSSEFGIEVDGRS